MRGKLQDDSSAGAKHDEKILRQSESANTMRDNSSKDDNSSMRGQ